MKPKLLKMSILLFSLTTMTTQGAQPEKTEKNYSLYYETCNKALEHQLEGDYIEAVKLYETAFENTYPFISDLNELKNCYVKLGKEDEAYLVVERMVLCGFKLKRRSYLVSSYKAIVGMKNVELEKDSVLVDRLIPVYDSLRKEFLKTIDYEKDKYLLSMSTLDRFTGCMRYNYRKDSEKEKFINDVGFTSVAGLFLNLIDSEYLPSRSESDAWDDQLNLALIHIAQSLEKKSEQDKFLNKLKELVISGDFLPGQYAVLYDEIHVRMRNNKKSYYGMSFEAVMDFDDPTKIQLSISSPEDVENVDKRRSEIFLPSLWVWAKQKGYVLPTDYKRK